MHGSAQVLFWLGGVVAQSCMTGVNVGLEANCKLCIMAPDAADEESVGGACVCQGPLWGYCAACNSLSLYIYM